MPLIENATADSSDDENSEKNEAVESVDLPETTDDEQQKSKLKTLQSVCGTDIIIKRRNVRSKRKPIIIYEEDLYDHAEPQQIIVKKKKGKGRPKNPAPLVEYVNDAGETVDKDDIDTQQVIINKPTKEKLSAKDLKMLALQEQILQLETVSGKKIRGTKKGAIDKRQTKPATEKQIAARKKFIENNKLRHAAKRAKKAEESALSQKKDVKIVIDELQQIKKKTLLDQEKAAVEKEKIRQELLAEQQAKPEKLKNTYDEFM